MKAKLLAFVGDGRNWGHSGCGGECARGHSITKQITSGHRLDSKFARRQFLGNRNARWKNKLPPPSFAWGSRSWDFSSLATPSKGCAAANTNTAEAGFTKAKTESASGS